MDAKTAPKDSLLPHALHDLYCYPRHDTPRCSESGRKLSQLTVRLTERANVTSVTLTWKNDRGKPYAPAKLEVRGAGLRGFRATRGWRFSVS